MDTETARCGRAVLTSLIFLLTLTASAVPATAQEYTMESNVNDIADQMERWAKECGAKPLTPEAQAKLSELLLETSRLLREIAANNSPEMQMQYHQEMTEVKKAWDPFDSRYGN